MWNAVYFESNGRVWGWLKDFAVFTDIFIIVIQDEEKLHGCRNKIK